MHNYVFNEACPILRILVTIIWIKYMCIFEEEGEKSPDEAFRPWSFLSYSLFVL